MFDANAKDGSVRKKPYESPIPSGAATKPVKTAKLDTEEMAALHGKLMSIYTQELDRQYENRREQHSDADFYDNIQWKEEDAAALKERGQMPLVYNVISASVDWVLGTEKRARTDFKVLPRRKQDSKPAERKSQLLKYLSDVNREHHHISRAFEDAVITGIGWIEDGIRDEDEDEPLYSRYESWRNMLWDSAATELDITDARYVIRTKWVDLDVACAMFKGRKHILEQSADDSDDFMSLDEHGDEAMDSQERELDAAAQMTAASRIEGHHRRRVRLIEFWMRQPVEIDKVKGGAFSGEIFDRHSPGHVEEVESGQAETVKRQTMQIHVAIMTTAGMLWFSPSPFRHNRFPFTPIWGHRRSRDGMPYGMIRRLKDIQEDINKRASKALYILSTNKVIMDDDALPEDMTMEEFQTEVSRPDGIIIKKKGSELTLNAERELSQWHLELMSRSIAMIQQASGVTDELMGRRTNATSGVAIQRRQDQGAMSTARYFDNLMLATQVHGEKLLANIEQFMTEEKQFRITNMRGNPDWIHINDGLPENDIVRSKADFVISEASWQATMRQAATAQLVEVLQQLAPAAPQLVMVMLDLIIESMDLPNQEELVKRIRAITGMRDPDQEEPSEEEVVRMQAQQQAQQAQQKLIQADAEAGIRKKLADAAKSEAQAIEYRARNAKTNVDAHRTAMESAQQALVVPAASHVADKILHESGFIARSEIEQMGNAMAEEQAAALQAAAQQTPPPPPGAGSPPGLGLGQGG